MMGMRRNTMSLISTPFDHDSTFRSDVSVQCPVNDFADDQVHATGREREGEGDFMTAITD